jgi:3',5'-cyclic AMP phosphodiesterase CpdA
MQGRRLGWLAATMLVACAANDDDASEVGTGGTESTGVATEGGTGETTDLPEPLPPLDAAPLTTERTIVPTHPIDTPFVFDPREVEEREEMLAVGYGAWSHGNGEPVMTITPDGSDPPSAGPSAAMITRFVHLADTQLPDDESPTRLVSFDSPAISGAFRPQEAHLCRILNAAARTINAAHAHAPIDFVVLGGDNADSAQTNEVEWFLGILDGAPSVHCDSGDDDDLIPGEDNDPKDRFAPVGLDVPWIWVTGNHDALVQGNLPIAGREAQAVGSEVPLGNSTRDWSQPGGPVFEGPVVPDPKRALLDGPALMALVASSGDGHGITDDVIASGRATYAWDVPGTNIRFLVVDTAAPTGAEKGVITDGYMASAVQPLFDQAEQDAKVVVVATHHASTSLSTGAGLGGTAQPDAWTPEEWQAFLADYPNVVMHLCGHSHENRVRFIEPVGASGYWEVLTPALADWPHQMRLIEMHDRDNGWLAIRAVGLDFSTEGDPIAEEGRELGILDLTSGWTGDAVGLPEDRNVELWVRAP